MVRKAYTNTPGNVFKMRQVNAKNSQKAREAIGRGKKRVDEIIEKIVRAENAVDATTSALRAAKKKWAACLKAPDGASEASDKAVIAFVDAITATARADAKLTAAIQRIQNETETVMTAYRSNKYCMLGVLKECGDVTASMQVQPGGSFLSKRGLLDPRGECDIPDHAIECDMTADWSVFCEIDDETNDQAREDEQDGNGDDDQDGDDDVMERAKTGDAEPQQAEKTGTIAGEDEAEEKECAKALLTRSDRAFLKNTRIKLSKHGFTKVSKDERKRIYKYYKRYSDLAKAQHLSLGKRRAELLEFSAGMDEFLGFAIAEISKMDDAIKHKFRVDVSE